MNALIKNWRTSLAGIGGGALIVIGEQLSGGNFDLKSIAIAVALALLGVVSKDHNVSGR